MRLFRVIVRHHTHISITGQSRFWQNSIFRSSPPKNHRVFHSQWAFSHDGLASAVPVVVCVGQSVETLERCPLYAVSRVHFLAQRICHSSHLSTPTNGLFSQDWLQDRPGLGPLDSSGMFFVSCVKVPVLVLRCLRELKWFFVLFPSCIEFSKSLFRCFNFSTRGEHGTILTWTPDVRT